MKTTKDKRRWLRLVLEGAVKQDRNDLIADYALQLLDDFAEMEKALEQYANKENWRGLETEDYWCESGNGYDLAREVLGIKEES